MLDFIRRHLPQFTIYVLSGGTAALVELGVFVVLVRLEVWYVAASVIGWFFAYVTAFLLHKYLVFRKRDTFLLHLRRHFILELCNVCVTTALLYGLVEYGELPKEAAKVLSMGMAVLWNFFFMKFFVFV